MKLTIIDNGYKAQADLLIRSVKERISAEIHTDSEHQKNGNLTKEEAAANLLVELAVNDKIGGEESYQIEKKENLWKITGADKAGLYYGIGKFLHSANWTDTAFAPKEMEGVVTPACSFRAAYFSVHFYNWYHTAPTEELERYLETMLLWGYNTIFCILPVVNFEDFKDPLFFELTEKTRAIYTFAKNLGMKVGTIINPNQGLKSTPDTLLADPSCYEHRTGGGGKNVCPAKEGAMEYLTPLWIKIFEQYEDIGLDYVMTWPYDEGGCGCEACSPWGGNGYLNMVNAVHDEAVKFFPNAKFIVSTWYFDEYFECVHDQGEFEGLYRRLKEDLDYVDYIMVDSHNNFPQYVLEHEIIKPIVNFPEISMHGVRSWGGRGANPAPKRFQRLWDSAKHVLSGGMPYSEGLYEDISKVQCVGYYWNPDSDYTEILGEYINYEYASEVKAEVLELMECIEENHVLVRGGNEPNPTAWNRAHELANLVDEKLSAQAKKSWRWRILYIRAEIDKILYEYHVENCVGKEKALYDLWNTREWYLADNDRAQDLMQELCHYYHTIDKFPGNKWTFPPVKRGKVLPFEPVQGVVFDCDGTLLNTERIYMGTWYVVGEEMGFDIPEDLLLRTRGKSKEVAHRMYREVMGEDFPVEEILKRRVNLNEEAFLSDPNPIKPGAKELLMWLQAHGIKVAVASSKSTQMTTDHLVHAGLAPYCDVIIGFDQVKNNKPAPDLFLKAAEMLGVEPGAMMAAGDTTSDVGAADAAGMRFVFIPDLIPVDEDIKMKSVRILNQIDEMIPLVEKYNS